MHCDWEQTAAKRERGHFEQRTSRQKVTLTKKCNFDSGWLERQQCDFHRLCWIL